MEVIIKIESEEFNQTLFDNIKKMFEGKQFTITIATDMDETGYLCANPANYQYLLDSIAQEPTVRFTPEEFDSYVEEHLKNS